jgi:hypothetical protein
MAFFLIEKKRRKLAKYQFYTLQIVKKWVIFIDGKGGGSRGMERGEVYASVAMNKNECVSGCIWHGGETRPTVSTISYYT